MSERIAQKLDLSRKLERNDFFGLLVVHVTSRAISLTGHCSAPWRTQAALAWQARILKPRSSHSPRYDEVEFALKDFCLSHTSARDGFIVMIAIR
jgi:hypothetical protein